MANHGSSHDAVDVGSVLNSLVRMLGEHQYAQQWLIDIVGRVELLKGRATGEEHLVRETERKLVQDIDRVTTTLANRAPEERSSEEFFFSGPIVGYLNSILCCRMTDNMK